jgi:hypothetical protein
MQGLVRGFKVHQIQLILRVGLPKEEKEGRKLSAASGQRWEGVGRWDGSYREGDLQGNPTGPNLTSPGTCQKGLFRVINHVIA